MIYGKESAYKDVMRELEPHESNLRCLRSIKFNPNEKNAIFSSQPGYGKVHKKKRSQHYFRTVPRGSSNRLNFLAQDTYTSDTFFDARSTLSTKCLVSLKPRAAHLSSVEERHRLAQTANTQKLKQILVQFLLRHKLLCMETEFAEDSSKPEVAERKKAVLEDIERLKERLGIIIEG